MLKCGASGVSVNPDWTVNHYRWIVWKFASLIRTFPDSYSPANLSPSWILSQLLYRYEREIHLCHRSALKKIVERDDAAGKYLCLMVSGVDYERKSLELSDGWYSIWTSSLDISLWSAVKSNRIVEGVKMEISGASLTGQDALPALEASSLDSPCKLVICRNSCRPARWDTKLGFMVSPRYKCFTFLKQLNQIHPQGGPIPAVSVIIDRVYPMLFKEERVVSESTIQTTRNERDHYLYLETHPEQAQTSKFTPIQRIRVSTNHVGPLTSVIVSFWNPLGEEQMALLQEGAAVIITNLRPSNRANSTSLSLVSTKSTRLFKDKDNREIRDRDTSNVGVNAPTAFVVIDSMHFYKLKDLKANDTIDLIGGIFLGRSGSYFWIGSPDNEESDMILVCLKNFPSISALAAGDSLNFRDLSFNHFDAREGVVHFNFTEYSDFRLQCKGGATGYKRSQSRFNELTK